MPSRLVAIVLLGIVQIAGAAWGGVLAAKTSPGQEKKAIHLWTPFAAGIAGLILTIVIGFQTYYSEKEDEKIMRESATLQQETDAALNQSRSELGRSLSSEAFIKGQLSGLSLMLGKPVINNSEVTGKLTEALTQIANFDQLRTEDAKAPNKAVCSQAIDYAKTIRDFQGQFDKEESNILTRYRLAAQKSTDASIRTDAERTELSQLFTNNIVQFQPYLSEARYLRDLLMERIPLDRRAVIRNRNLNAEKDLNDLTMAGAHPEYDMAAYLEGLAHAVCPI